MVGGMARSLVHGGWPFLPVEYRSGPENFEEFYVHAARETIYVASGICEMEIREQGIFKLRPGDSLYYDAHVQHRWRQVSKGSIRVLLIQENADAVAAPLDTTSRTKGSKDVS